ncbi:hypothetical protein RB195_001653 [Necator americanus]|uniref:Major sperm protein n=1 Tax=Necator americanus TaxID=51031 RepID=A0ABR1DFB8_NECAM
MTAVRLNAAGSDEPQSASVVFLDQTLVVFDIEQAKNATQVIHISRVPKTGLVSFRFQTNAPTRYIVSPNCGIIENDKPVPIWDDPRIDEPGRFQTIWIELGTTIMSLEHAFNLTDPQNAKVTMSVAQLLSASNSRGADRVKELEDLKAMLRADNETLQRNIQQTTNLKAVIEKQLKERSAEAKEFHAKEEKLTAEEDRLYADVMRDESELNILKERRSHPENCILM